MDGKEWMDKYMNEVKMKAMGRNDKKEQRDKLVSETRIVMRNSSV